MKPLTILYVDDDADIRSIVRIATALDPGLTLAEATSDREALALVDSGLVPDVAVLDAMMPETSGPSLMDVLHARSATAGMPVIVMTARTRPADVARHRARGAIGVIAAPFDPLTLAQRIRALVETGEDMAG